MNYILTFEDGSTGYLSHHGVKGMHWGVWNEETRQRRLGHRDIHRMIGGATNYKEAKSNIRKNIGDIRSEKTKQSALAMNKALKEHLDSEREIGGDPTESQVFLNAQKTAAEKYIKSELKINGQHYPKGSRDRMKLEEYAYDDLGYDAGMKAFKAKYPNYGKTEKAYNDAFSAYYNNLKNDVNNLVDSTGDRMVNTSYSGTLTYKDMVQHALDEIGNEEYRKMYGK